MKPAHDRAERLIRYPGVVFPRGRFPRVSSWIALRWNSLGRFLPPWKTPWRKNGQSLRATWYSKRVGKTNSTDTARGILRRTETDRATISETEPLADSRGNRDISLSREKPEEWNQAPWEFACFTCELIMRAVCRLYGQGKPDSRLYWKRNLSRTTELPACLPCLLPSPCNCRVDFVTMLHETSPPGLPTLIPRLEPGNWNLEDEGDRGEDLRNDKRVLYF